jgi:hypothetical protein
MFSSEKLSEKHNQSESSKTRKNSLSSTARRRPTAWLIPFFSALDDIEEKEKKSQKCSNKFCDQQGTTRRKVNEKIVFFCHSCLEAFHKKQYCEICKQIYTDTSCENASGDGEDWLQCNTCQRWSHVKCQTKQENADFPTQILDPSFFFHCNSCRKSTQIHKKNTKKREMTVQNVNISEPEENVRRSSRQRKSVRANQDEYLFYGTGKSCNSICNNETFPEN